MEMKHPKTRPPDNRLPVDQAKTTNMERLVFSTAPNRSYLPPYTVEDTLDLLPFNSVERFRSVSKSLFSLLAIKFNVPKLLYYPYITNFPPPNYGMISDYSRDPLMIIRSLQLQLQVVIPDVLIKLRFSDYKVFAATAPGGNPRRAYKVEGSVGLFLNGALHWQPRESTWGEKGEIIAIAFDLDKEKFYHIPSPPNQKSRRHESSVFGVVGEYLCSFHRDWYTNIIWVMKEYCNKGSWVPFISYTHGKVAGCLTYVCDFIPRSFKDGRYMMQEFAIKDGENIHVLNWNSNIDESVEAGEYSKKIKFYSASRNRALPYTQTLISPNTCCFIK
ncbi:hypothetical protein Tsubulata_039679 [Turnera subulata]|uniref:F-box associated beta-propeller type 1 domain-containing protein n=1 Tax=Turnera subulata TaxID=218843 RepID=A0A9Q0FPA0_9ROSI|nr:hypothetical protein Tsubulata_039679 [Turnera subulata]